MHVKLFGFAVLVFSAWGFAPTFVDAMAEKRAYDQSTSEAERIGILEDTGWKPKISSHTMPLGNASYMGTREAIGSGAQIAAVRVEQTGSISSSLTHRGIPKTITRNVKPVLANAAIGSALNAQISHDQATVAPKPSPRQKGTVTRVISTYSDYYIGRKMSNGVPYDPEKLTVASNDWKLGTRLRITYNGKSVTATVTDRMAKRFSGIRVDSSTAVWKALGGGKPGLKKGATVEKL